MCPQGHRRPFQLGRAMWGRGDEGEGAGAVPERTPRRTDSGGATCPQAAGAEWRGVRARGREGTRRPLDVGTEGRLGKN